MEDEIVMARDARCWNLELENEAGKKFRWSGNLLNESFPGANEMSDLVGETGIEDLFGFDGCPDRIEELEFRHHQKTAICHEGSDDKPVFIELNESLTIERKTEILKHIHGLRRNAR